jgi:hypothetical protein
MAIGITMYNEDWKLFLRTVTGICQGLIDIYYDEKKLHLDAGKQMISWNKFKDQFVIVLVADGFIDLTYRKDYKNAEHFPENAKEWGIFDESLVKNNFYKKDKGKPLRLFSIEEIAEEVIRLDPETAQFDIEALMEMD